jgi:hypothetical protein
MQTIQTVETNARVGETEKMTINLGVVDLGQIDLLVQEGFYSNRSDLVRTAICLRRSLRWPAAATGCRTWQA